MEHLKRILVLLTVCYFGKYVSCMTPPTFPDQYQVSGILHMPYAEIKEPFTAFYDAKANSSRVNYYNGMMDTFQLASIGPYGVTRTLAFMSNNTKLNVRKCFELHGRKNFPVRIQGTLPDLTNYTYHGTEKCPSEGMENESCQVWKISNIKRGPFTYVKTDTMWVKTGTDGPVPVRRERISYADKYYFSFNNYVSGEIDPQRFEIEKNLTCGGFPGPGIEAVHLHNPINEFITGNEGIVDQAFDDFKAKHGKVYGEKSEHDLRKNTFRNNFRYIHSTNRQGNTFTLAVNHLADLTEDEMKMMQGNRPTKGYNGGAPFEDKIDASTMPAFMDWRYYGAVTPVKDQGICGSCWSFGSTGTLEGAYFLKTGKLINLSEQQLMDCSWGQGNNGCNGGEDFRVYRYMLKNGGIESTQTYGSYLMADGKCHHKSSSSVMQIKSYVNVTSGNLAALQTAIYKRGPIFVAIDASLRSFHFYSNGVYYDQKCRSENQNLDHAVLAVGYGVLDGEAYWLIKNSWSTYWGNDGYILMSQRNNSCGVATAASFPILV